MSRSWNQRDPMNGDQEHDVQEPKRSCSELSMRGAGSGVSAETYMYT